MKKKWLALNMACIIAGTIALGAGCNNASEVNPVVTVQDGYVYVDGKKTDVKVNSDSDPVVTVQDGYVYVDGQKTDIKVNSDSDPVVTVQNGYVYVDGKKTDIKVNSDSGEQKTAFELWKKDNPAYTGTEAEWLEWLQQLVDKKGEEGDMLEYKLIENGTFKGNVESGSVSTEASSSSLVLKNAALRLNESVVLPIGSNSSWEVNITGRLLTGTSTDAQLLAGNSFSQFGRVYIGVNKSSKMLYLGVRINTVYVNYGWRFDDASVFGAQHSYAIGYENGAYYLSVDGGQKQPMSYINFNQKNSSYLEAPAADAKNLNELIRTLTAQDYIEMTNIGVEGFACNSKLSNFTVKTSAINSYQKLSAHPLAKTKIFYLGSSITYGSSGVAFAEIINRITGNPFAKEAVSGTTLVDNGSSSYIQRMKNGKLKFSDKPDFFVVQLSTNDFGQGYPTGTVEEGTNSSDFDTSTISGAIQHIIAYAKEQCPTVKVVFYVGSTRNSWGYRTAYENYVNGDFKKICQKWEIEPLDIFHSNYRDYSCYWNDDIHPTIEGYSAGWTPLFVKYFEEHI